MINEVELLWKNKEERHRIENSMIITSSTVINMLFEQYVDIDKEQEVLLDMITKTLHSKKSMLIDVVPNHYLYNVKKENKFIIVNDTTYFCKKYMIPYEHIKDFINFIIIPIANTNYVILTHSKYVVYTFNDVLKIYPIVSRICTLCKSNNTVLNTQHKPIDNLKNMFLAMISHEIRTPLNGIIGIAQLLNEMDELTNKQKEYVHILNECSVQLISLINDILDFSKLNANQLTLIPYTFSLNKCIYNAIDVIQLKAKEKNIDIRLEIKKPLPLKTLGDERRVTQILVNLLSNAVKFTEEGMILIEVDYECVHTQYNMKFRITDTGCGIPKYEQTQIFEMFNKAYHSDIDNKQIQSGAGLGLAITKYLVELMNGIIRVESDGQHGTTFLFNIVLDQDEYSRKLEDYNIFKDKKIAIIDDNLQDRLYLMDTLQKWNMHVHLFYSIKEFNAMNNHTFDILLMNIQMYNYENINLEHIKTPIIGMSTNTEYNTTLSICSYILKKPISRSILFNTLTQVVKVKEIQKPTNIHTIYQTPSIIIAEDDKYNQLLLKEFLINYGIIEQNISFANNGQECIDMIIENDYNICFMDIKMPILNGIDATKHIRNINKNIIIIGVSASILETDHNKCYDVGMNYFIEKPVDKQKLFDILNNIIT